MLKKAENIYKKIDFLFHPCGTEGFGRIYIEAMGKGVPVVCVKGGGADELVEHGITGYKVNQNNPEGAADLLSELMLNCSKYNKVSDNGFRYAVTNFQSSKMWHKINNILS